LRRQRINSWQAVEKFFVAVKANSYREPKNSFLGEAMQQADAKEE
jgi:hypothetical protein